MTLITLSGRRWNTHGSSKEGRGKEAGSEKASQKGGSKEEIISSYNSRLFCDFFMSVFRATDSFSIHCPVRVFLQSPPLGFLKDYRTLEVPQRRGRANGESPGAYLNEQLPFNKNEIFWSPEYDYLFKKVPDYFSGPPLNPSGT